MTQTVSPTSLLTLHYRIRQADGSVLISTFESQPATLQLGQGELLPSLERCLIGLPMGEHTRVSLAAGEAFGPHNPALVQRVLRSELPDDVDLEPHVVLSFTAPDGNSFSGLVREVSEADALIDFNHPLAGRAVEFEVQIIGIL